MFCLVASACRASGLIASTPGPARSALSLSWTPGPHAPRTTKQTSIKAWRAGRSAGWGYLLALSWAFFLKALLRKAGLRLWTWHFGKEIPSSMLDPRLSSSPLCLSLPPTSTIWPAALAAQYEAEGTVSPFSDSPLTSFLCHVPYHPVLKLELFLIHLSPLSPISSHLSNSVSSSFKMSLAYVPSS